MATKDCTCSPTLNPTVDPPDASCPKHGTPPVCVELPRAQAVTLVNHLESVVAKRAPGVRRALLGGALTNLKRAIAPAPMSYVEMVAGGCKAGCRCLLCRPGRRS